MDITLISLITLSIIYTVLGIFAYQDTTKETKGSALSPTWSFNKKAYGKTGQALCNIASPIFFITAVLFIWLFIQ